MIITIKDDFDLDKITNSGQAFRIKVFEDGTYRFITKTHILYIRQESSPENDKYHVSVSEDEWNTIWVPYFDLGRSYTAIRNLIPSKDKYLSQAADYGTGLRILRQDPWEMLITFIISQRKNIPAIKESVEKICKAYGREITTPYETLRIFPSAEEMSGATLEELRKCSLGYRDSYIMDAVSKVLSGEINLTILESCDYETTFNALLSVRGVGAKVSNCICLFAYSQFSAAPVDTWISKVIEKHYNGINPFPNYGDVAGIMQQYIFYYAQMHKDSY